MDTNRPDQDVDTGSMWALNGFPDAWAKRLAPQGVWVNGLGIGVGARSSDFSLANAEVPRCALQVLATDRTRKNVPCWAGQSQLPPSLPLHQRHTG